MSGLFNELKRRNVVRVGHQGSLAAAGFGTTDCAVVRLEFAATIYHQLGEVETAQQKLQKLIENYDNDASWQVASVYSAWGDKDATIAALERGFAVRDPGLIYILGSESMTELLTGDPRYDDLLKRMNLR